MIKKLYLAPCGFIGPCPVIMRQDGRIVFWLFHTNPEVLEAIGGKVPVTINGKFPEKVNERKKSNC